MSAQSEGRLIQAVRDYLTAMHEGDLFGIEDRLDDLKRLTEWRESE